MNRFITTLAAALLLLSPLAMSGQTSKAVKSQMKESRKSINSKSSKAARKEAKQYSKAGWLPLEGSLPLEKQLDERYVREGMLDEDGESIYYFGEGSYSTDDKNAAYKFACDAARQDIAAQLEVQLAEAYSTDVRSQKLNSDESVAINDAFAKGKAVVSAKLAGVKPIVKMYRRNKYQYEVQVVLIYSREKANELARKAAREELAAKNPGLEKLLDDVMSDVSRDQEESDEDD